MDDIAEYKRKLDNLHGRVLSLEAVIRLLIVRLREERTTESLAFELDDEWAK